MRKIFRLAVVLLILAGTVTACGLFENETDVGRIILYAVESSSTSARPVVIQYRDEVETWTITHNLSTTAAWVGEFPAEVGFDLLLNAHFETAGDPDTLTVLIFVDQEIVAEDWCATPGCTASLTMEVPKIP
ncbi:hypothetical protein ACFL4Y_01810 [Gemmatimonadota bacterium]